MVGEIEQHQGLRRGRVAADAQPLLFEFLIAGLGDIARELPFPSFHMGFRLRHDQEPARIRRQFGAADHDLVSQIKRQHGTRDVALLQGLGVFAGGLGVVMQFLQGGKGTQLHFAQIIRGRRRIRIFLRFDDGSRGRYAAAEIVQEPIMVDAET